MYIMQVHNKYRIDGGENVFVDHIIDLLSRKKVKVFLFSRNSNVIKDSRWKRIAAFISGIYSLEAIREIKELINLDRPDVVHVHNLYPFISPSILIACKHARIPVVMTCHNFRLYCPTGMLFNEGKICQLCTNGHEYWCFIKNCRKSRIESFGYALRNFVAMRFRIFLDNVTIFTAPSMFAKLNLIKGGIPSDRIVVVPNMIRLPSTMADRINGKYVGYVGRISPEKGIKTLLRSISKTKFPLHLAGDHSLMPEILKNPPPNVRFLGNLKALQLKEFYQNARFLIVPSECYETFGLIAAEAMSYGLPVIASRIGSLPEIVEDCKTGLLFKPGDSIELTEKINLLWKDSKLCTQLGSAGREKVIRDYDEEYFFNTLLKVYSMAIEIAKNNKIP